MRGVSTESRSSHLSAQSKGSISQNSAGKKAPFLERCEKELLERDDSDDDDEKPRYMKQTPEITIDASCAAIAKPSGRDRN